MQINWYYSVFFLLPFQAGGAKRVRDFKKTISQFSFFPRCFWK